MEEQGNTSVLKIFLGDEYKVRVEEPGDFANSFFTGIYTRATNAVVEIKRDSDRLRNRDGKDKGKIRDNNFNNLIAFVGERGSGKSSAMISFAEFLEKIKSEKEQTNEPNELKGLTFHTLNPIDPTLFADGESIIRNIIANMFAAFKERIKDAMADDYSFEQKNEVIKKFQDVYESLKMLSVDEKKLFEHHKHSESSLETLAGLAMGSRLRERILGMIEAYMHFMEGTHGEKGREKNYLVIPIDDLDMNMKHSAQVLEDIRRYLMAPNIVVLMAMKLDQLRDSVEQEYLRELEVLRRANKESYATTEEMANRYLEKVVPMERRLFLPVVKVPDSDSGAKTKLYFGENKELSEKDVEGLAPIRDTVLGMIYEATGIIFFVTEEEHNLIVPETLRELQNFLVFLHRLIEESKEGRLEKLKYFKSYFLHIWAKNVLEKQHERFLFELDQTPNRRKNKFIIQNYLKYYAVNATTDKNRLTNNKLMMAYDEFIFDFIEIVEPQNAPENVSVGDVIAYLGMISEQEDHPQARRLNFAIKTLLTIEMQIALESDNGDVCQSIIGGRIYHSKWHEYIPGRESASRMFFPINGLDRRFFPNTKEETESESTLGGYTSQLRTALGTKDFEGLENFELYELLYCFLFGNQSSFGHNFRNPKRNKNAPTPFWSGSVNPSFGYFDMLAWIHFAANPKGHIWRITQAENSESTGIGLPRLKSYSLFWSGESIKCPFPILYNVGFFEVFLRRLRESFRGQQRASGDRHLRNRTLMQIVNTTMETVRDTLNSGFKRNQYLLRPWERKKLLHLDPAESNFFKMINPDKSEQGSLMEKIFNELPPESTPVSENIKENSPFFPLLQSLRYHLKNAHSKYKHVRIEGEIITALVKLQDEYKKRGNTDALEDIESVLQKAEKLRIEVKKIRDNTGRRMRKDVRVVRDEVLRSAVILLENYPY